jgi:oligopeptide/dipeptide ABC transporter ATP-binding protein
MPFGISLIRGSEFDQFHDRKQQIAMSSPLLAVDNLQTRFKVGSGCIHAVNGISYQVAENETVALVGESGCGKTTSQLSVMRLISYPGEIAGGKIIFEGQDLLGFEAKSKKMCEIRGGKIAMIFQEPTSALNPVLTIGRQMTEMLGKHLGMSSAEAKKKSVELLAMVKIPGAGDRLKDYPHQFSGGMLQRVMIAMALSCSPKLLIADEPTSALDVTTQAHVLELLNTLVAHCGASMVLVTHNLGIVAKYAQRTIIMYAGQIVESGITEDVFANPRHPYTIGLLNSIPRINAGKKSNLVPIKGSPPNLSELPANCAFLPRCESKSNDCRCMPVPTLTEAGARHYVRCHVQA